jgi:hypothetical protein
MAFFATRGIYCTFPTLHAFFAELWMDTLYLAPSLSCLLPHDVSGADVDGRYVAWGIPIIMGMVLSGITLVMAGKWTDPMSGRHVREKC